MKVIKFNEVIKFISRGIKLIKGVVRGEILIFKLFIIMYVVFIYVVVRD